MGAPEMLRSVGDFKQIQGQSHSRAHPTLLMRYRKNELDRTRYGISTGRRVGSAVVRNTVRRRLRTILRRLEGQVEPGWDVLLVARPAAAQASQAELDQALVRLMSSAGLLRTQTTGTN
ncbi:MAG: ribonuclease P protein component [Candidatus Limnocylindrales bacterium]